MLAGRWTLNSKRNGRSSDANRNADLGAARQRRDDRRRVGGWIYQSRARVGLLLQSRPAILRGGTRVLDAPRKCAFAPVSVIITRDSVFCVCVPDLLASVQISAELNVAYVAIDPLPPPLLLSLPNDAQQG